MIKTSKMKTFQEKQEPVLDENATVILCYNS